MLKNISLRYKILGSFLTIVMVIVIGCGTIYFYSNQVKKDVKYVSEDLMKLNILTAKMKYVVVNVQRLIVNGSLIQDEDIVLEAASQAKEFHEYFTALNEILYDMELKNSIAGLSIEFENFFASAVAMSSFYVSDLIDEGEEKMEEVIELSENINSSIIKFEQGAQGILHDKIRVVERSLQLIIRIIFVIVGISMLMTVFVLWRSTRDLVKPIERLNRNIAQTSECDLTVEFKVDSSDEIGTINQSMAWLNSKFKNMIADIITSTELLASSVEQLSVSSGQAADTAKEAIDLATKGGEVVTSTIDGMNKIARSVNDSAETIEILGKESEQIGEIIKVINDIAGQTNLLALNAAIEAARAGEQGRGFAVVADEVRKLAERTTNATSEIGQMIQSNQENTNKVVESMKTGTAEVNKGVELASQAGESLQQIVDSVKQVTNLIEQIAIVTFGQTTASEAVTENIKSVSGMKKENLSGVQASVQSSEGLRALAEELQQMVSVFKIDQGADTKESQVTGIDNTKVTSTAA